MALPVPRPVNEAALCESTTSIATTPVAVTAVVTTAGYIQRGMAAAGGTTTGTIAVAVSVNGGADIFGGRLTVAAGTGARNGGVVELPMVGSSAVFVQEGDCISFTPSGGTGAGVSGAFAVVIRTI